MFRVLIHPSSGACDLLVQLFHGFYCSVRIEVFALAYLFSGECLVVTCVVVLESAFLQILTAAVSYGYRVFFLCVVCFLIMLPEHILMTYTRRMRCFESCRGRWKT